MDRDGADPTQIAASLIVPKKPLCDCLPGKRPLITVGCAVQSMSGPGSLIGKRIRTNFAHERAHTRVHRLAVLPCPCIYEGILCGPPYCAFGDANPAETLFGNEGSKGPAPGLLAYLLCTPVCLVAYLPVALVGCCDSKAVNVGPFCYFCGYPASLRKGSFFPGAVNCDGHKEEDGNWVGEYED